MASNSFGRSEFLHKVRVLRGISTSTASRMFSIEGESPKRRDQNPRWTFFEETDSLSEPALDLNRILYFSESLITEIASGPRGESRAK